MPSVRLSEGGLIGVYDCQKSRIPMAIVTASVLLRIKEIRSVFQKVSDHWDRAQPLFMFGIHIYFPEQLSPRMTLKDDPRPDIHSSADS